MNRLRWIWMIAVLGLTGCGPFLQPEPIAIGGDRDQLKQSPCACLEVPQNYGVWRRPG